MISILSSEVQEMGWGRGGGKSGLIHESGVQARDNSLSAISIYMIFIFT